MSTKSTIVYSNNPEHAFHFYHECLDDENVYLELNGPDLEYEAHRGSVMVRIPIEIWEVIRHRGGADLQFADWTDEQIQSYVEQEVDAYLSKLQENLEKYGEERAWIDRFLGCAVFGMRDEPREKQIENGLSYYLDLRDRQTKIKRRIEAIEAEQRR